MGKIIALDAGSGRELWKFDAGVELTIGFGDPVSRGVSYWAGIGAETPGTLTLIQDSPKIKGRRQRRGNVKPEGFMSTGPRSSTETPSQKGVKTDPHFAG